MIRHADLQQMYSWVVKLAVEAGLSDVENKGKMSEGRKKVRNNMKMNQRIDRRS